MAAPSHFEVRVRRDLDSGLRGVDGGLGAELSAGSRKHRGWRVGGSPGIFALSMVCWGRSDRSDWRDRESIEGMNLGALQFMVHVESCVTPSSIDRRHIAGASRASGATGGEWVTPGASQVKVRLRRELDMCNHASGPAIRHLTECGGAASHFRSVEGRGRWGSAGCRGAGGGGWGDCKLQSLRLRDTAHGVLREFSDVSVQSSSNIHMWLTDDRAGVVLVAADLRKSGGIWRASP